MTSHDEEMLKVNIVGKPHARYELYGDAVTFVYPGADFVHSTDVLWLTKHGYVLVTVAKTREGMEVSFLHTEGNQ